jgi:SAM-dependent methyltransferase
MRESTREGAMPAGVSASVRQTIEAANALIFDREAESRLGFQLENLCLEAYQWERIDEKCPPSNAYVYALQRLGDVCGKTILDFGCGDGYLSVILAKRGAKVVAFDISQASAQLAKKRTTANCTEESVRILRASAFTLPFKDRSFDHVIGIGILHHLWFDLREVSKEISRVLKRDGTAVFQEAFGNSWLLRAMRRWIPVEVEGNADTEQRQLRYSDIVSLSEIFKEVRIKEFQIFSRLDRVLKLGGVIRFLHISDDWLLAKCPWLRRFARMIVLELQV